MDRPMDHALQRPPAQAGAARADLLVVEETRRGAARPARPPGTPPAPLRRMLQLGTGWFPERKGGAENVFHSLLPQFRRAGFEVEGVVPGSPLAGEETAGRVRSYDPAGLSLPQRALALRRAAAPLFREGGPDVVGAHFALYALPLLDRIRRRPFVVHFHGPWAMEGAAEGDGLLTVRAKRAVERAVYRRADRIIVLSEAFARVLREQYGVPETVIRRVPGGVDCDRFATGLSRDEARLRLGWERDRPVLLTVRRLVRRMGLDSLIAALAQLPGPGREAVLHIVGTGPERAALEAQAAALGLGWRVRFTGPLPDALLPLAYRAADLAVVPTHALEGFGLVAAEALAAGTPVLVTPVGGLPEVVAGLSERLVLEGRGAVEIARGLAAALHHPGDLPDAAACAAYARARFDWRAVGARMAAVYRDVL